MQPPSGSGQTFLEFLGFISGTCDELDEFPGPGPVPDSAGPAGRGSAARDGP